MKLLQKLSLVKSVCRRSHQVAQLCLSCFPTFHSSVSGVFQSILRAGEHTLFLYERRTLRIPINFKAGCMTFLAAFSKRFVMAPPQQVSTLVSSSIRKISCFAPEKQRFFLLASLIDQTKKKGEQYTDSGQYYILSFLCPTSSRASEWAN